MDNLDNSSVAMSIMKCIFIIKCILMTNFVRTYCNALMDILLIALSLSPSNVA